MKRPGLIGTAWPDERELLLLHASVGPPERAAEAWNAFAATNPLDDLWDGECIALLPLLPQRLAAAGVDHPELGRLKGIYRKAWYARQLARTALHSAVDVLAEAGLDSALAPGSDLTGPVGRCGLVVAPGALDASVAALAANGWELSGNRHRRAPWRAVVQARNSAGTAVDLQATAGRWLVDERDPATSCEQTWARRRRSTTSESGCTTLSPADAFVAVCTDGPTPGSPFHLRWTVFADAILGQEVDTEQVIDTSEAFGVLPLVASACSFLRNDLELEPAEMLAESLEPLARRHPDRARLHRITSIRPTRARGTTLRADWARTRRTWSLVHATRELPGYLADRWGADSAAGLPRAAVARLHR